MAGLLYKEFILNKTMILSTCIGFLFFTGMWMFPADADSIIGSDELSRSVYGFMLSLSGVIMYLMIGSIQQSIFMPDERKKWADFIGSTPLSIKGQVASKYIFSLILSFAMLTYLSVILSINAVIQGRDSGVMNVMIIIFILQIYLRSIEFPFIVRFGGKTGNNFRIAISFVLTFGVIIYYLFGDLSIFGTMDEFFDWFFGIISGKGFGNVLSLLTALSPFIAGAMYYISYRISCRLYMKGVENYEK